MNYSTIRNWANLSNWNSSNEERTIYIVLVVSVPALKLFPVTILMETLDLTIRDTNRIDIRLYIRKNWNIVASLRTIRNGLFALNTRYNLSSRNTVSDIDSNWRPLPMLDQFANISPLLRAIRIISYLRNSRTRCNSNNSNKRSVVTLNISNRHRYLYTIYSRLRNVTRNYSLFRTIHIANRSNSVNNSYIDYTYHLRTVLNIRMWIPENKKEDRRWSKR